VIKEEAWNISRLRNDEVKEFQMFLTFPEPESLESSQKVPGEETGLFKTANDQSVLGSASKGSLEGPVLQKCF